MRTLRKYRLREESFEAQNAARRWHPAQVLRYKLRREGPFEVTLGCGSTDEVWPFLDGHYLVVLTLNRRMGYAGVEVFNGSCEVGDLFCQSDEQLAECVGPRGLDLKPITLAKRLGAYVTDGR